jgi:hypothetical protein
MELNWATANNTGLGTVDVLYKVADALLRSVEAALPAAALVDFANSVTWTEPFIYGLLLAQIAIFAATALLRRSSVAHALLFVVMCAVVACARALNSFGAKHWPKFATQNYFDSQGLFMLIFVCGPLLLAANLIVVRCIAHVILTASRPSNAQIPPIDVMDATLTACLRFST